MIPSAEGVADTWKRQLPSAAILSMTMFLKRGRDFFLRDMKEKKNFLQNYAFNPILPNNFDKKPKKPHKTEKYYCVHLYMPRKNTNFAQ